MPGIIISSSTGTRPMLTSHRPQASYMRPAISCHRVLPIGAPLRSAPAAGIRLPHIVLPTQAASLAETRIGSFRRGGSYREASSIGPSIYRISAACSSSPQQQQATGKATAGRGGPATSASLPFFLLGNRAVNAAASPTSSSSSSQSPAGDTGGLPPMRLFGFVSDWWADIPARSKLVAACGSSFMLSNMDKVNMTVAVIPISQELGWSTTVTGLVQSAFFWGFLLGQVPGGYLSSRFGGRQTLPPSVAVWSVATALLPLTISSLPALCATRSLMGAGEAIAPSAVVDMLARSIPKEQRAGAVSSAFGGLHMGSVIGLLASPAIINAFGWRSLFGAFGVMGVLWYFLFQVLMEDIGRQDPQLLQLLDPAAPAVATAPKQASSKVSGFEAGAQLLRRAAGNQRGDSLAQRQKRQHGQRAHAVQAVQTVLHVPYRAMLRSRPVQVLAFTHFCHNWLHYTMMAWLPSYFVDTLAVDLLHASQTALLPPLAGVAASAVAGRAADRLIAAGVPVATVRKAAQCTAFAVPAVLLTAVCTHGGEQPHAAEQAAAASAAAAAASAPAAEMASAVVPVTGEAALAAAGAAAEAVSVAASGLSGEAAVIVAAITLALGLSSFSLAGLYCTHGDLSPKYASAMLGLTNTAAAIPGVFGVALIGIMLDQTGHSWELSLFAPAAVLLTAGAAAYALLGSNDEVDFDAMDDSPFAWERRLLPVRRAWDSVVKTAGMSKDWE